jgi:hypothetical protein
MQANGNQAAPNREVADVEIFLVKLFAGIVIGLAIKHLDL